MIGKIFLTLFAAAALFIGGYVYSRVKSTDARLNEHYFRVLKVPGAERDFLLTLDASQLLPPKLETGAYVLEIRTASGKATREIIHIPFANNKFAFEVPRPLSRIGMEESARIDGHVVSWHVAGTSYDPGVKFVGVVSGSQMFGHVYNYEQTPEGQIGFWRLFPEEKDKAKGK
jgi:hypothetical protein